MATMQFQRFAEQIDVKVSAKRLWWGLIKDSQNCLPKSLPDKIASVDYQGGRFGEVGSIRKINFHKGVHHFEFVREKVEEVDEQKLYVKLHVIEGGFQGLLFENFNLTFQFNEGSVKWSVEYKALAERKFPDEVKEYIWNTVKAVEAFLLANKNEYA